MLSWQFGGSYVRPDFLRQKLEKPMHRTTTSSVRQSIIRLNRHRLTSTQSRFHSSTSTHDDCAPMTCYATPLIITDLTPNVRSMIMTSAHVFTSPEPSVKVAHLLHYSQSQSVVPNKTATTTTNNTDTITCAQSESESEKDVELLRRIALEMDHPARPTLPVLSDVKQVPSLKDSGLSQPVYMLHNCAHIELNAMDVCCHTVLMPSLFQLHLNSGRRSDRGDTLKEQTSENATAATILHLPEEFYADFMRVARDEARHFQMLSDRLRELGASYGVLNSHKMLWQGAERTSNSLLARIVMCQLINECRGLDSGPRLVHKLKSSGDHASAQIMQQIVNEEEEHVRIGMKWFLALCEQMNLRPQETFQDIVSQFYGKLIPPFNHDARSRATMPRTWYEPLARRTT